MTSPRLIPTRRTICRSSGSVALAAAIACLQLDGAFHSVDGAGELDQDAVAHDLDDPAAMLGDEGIEDVLTPLPSARPAFPPRPPP